MKKEMNVKVYEKNVRGNVPYWTTILLSCSKTGPSKTSPSTSQPAAADRH